MSESDPSATRQLVVFMLGSEEYALPIGAVHEVIRYQRPRAVTSGDSTLLGVINLRGQIVPVHDVRGVLGLTPTGDGNEKIVLVDAGGAIAGVVVDDVSEVLTAPATEFEDLPAAGNAIVEGVVKSGERLIILLDASSIAGLAGGGPLDEAVV